MASTIEVFCCYARKDKVLLDELKTHLIPLQRRGFITIWNDTDISPGTDWEEEIDKHLNTAHIILLLVSPSLIASEYCYSKEMKRAIERHNQGEARVIPVLLRPVHWEDAPFGKLQALPINGKPVTDGYWHSRDEAFYEITTGIQRVVEELSSMSDKKVLRQKFLQYKEALEEITHTGFDFCPECGSTEFTIETQIDYSLDELYEFKRCSECDNLWE